MRVVAESALEEYDLDVVRTRAMPDATNGVFGLDCSNGERYAMRVGMGPPSGHSVDDMRSEMEWLQALGSLEAPSVPRPVAEGFSQRAIGMGEGIGHTGGDSPAD